MVHSHTHTHTRWDGMGSYIASVMLVFAELTTWHDSDTDYMDTAHAVGELFRNAL